MAEEAVNCFTTLLESVPKWIAELEHISKSANDKQNERLFENKPADPQQELTKKLSKSSSLRTNPKDDEAKPQQNQQDEGILLRPQLPHMTASDVLRLAQRKRKTASVCSGRQSGPLKYRSRGMVVVYYDGEAQKQFETLVRSIGTSRNSLRKAKMSAKVDAVSRSDSGSSEGSSSDDAVLDIEKLGYRPVKLRGRGTPEKDDGTGVFDKVDGFLERAQTLCERAAHQILRDGDCAEEIKNATKHFDDACKMCETELPALQKRIEKSTEMQRRSEERKAAKSEKADEKRALEGSSNEKLVDSDSPFSSPATLEVDLEADDSDGDEGAYTMNALQLGRYNMRSSRLAAH